MPSEDKSAPEPLARLLWRAHHWFRTAVTAGLEDSTGGVSPANATLLSQLDPDGMPMADLARLMGVSTPAIHQMVHHLVSLGLLEVAPNPRSGRSKLVLLTPDGFTRRREAMELLADLEDELAHRIGRRRVTALRDALEQDWGDTTDTSRLLIEPVRGIAHRGSREPITAGVRGRAARFEQRDWADGGDTEIDPVLRCPVW